MNTLRGIRWTAALGASLFARVAQAQVDCGPRSYGRPNPALSDCVCNAPAFVRVVRDGSPTCRPAPPPPPAVAVFAQRPESAHEAPVVARPAPPRPNNLLVPVARPNDTRPAVAASAASIAWVPVPAGQFTMSVDDTAHPVRLGAFEIMRAEATVAQYAGCVDAGACSPTATRAESDPACNARRATRSEHPINCVTWDQAVSFCRWAGGRLPTEAEWEFSARGADGRAYPWGAAAPDRQVCWGRPSHRLQSTCAVGRFRAGASPFGALDMAGNVAEWVADWYAPLRASSQVATDPQGPETGPTRVIRGGHWSSGDATLLSATWRGGWPTALPQSDLGMRCVRSPRGAGGGP